MVKTIVRKHARRTKNGNSIVRTHTRKINPNRQKWKGPYYVHSESHKASLPPGFTDYDRDAETGKILSRDYLSKGNKYTGSERDTFFRKSKK